MWNERSKKSFPKKNTKNSQNRKDEKDLSIEYMQTLNQHAMPYIPHTYRVISIL